MNINLQPRHEWLRKRVDDCLDAIHQSRLEEDFKKYQELIIELSQELYYAGTEWNKYYPGV